MKRFQCNAQMTSNTCDLHVFDVICALHWHLFIYMTSYLLKTLERFATFHCPIKCVTYFMSYYRVIEALEEMNLCTGRFGGVKISLMYEMAYICQLYHHIITTILAISRYHQFLQIVSPFHLIFQWISCISRKSDITTSPKFFGEYHHIT